MSDVNEKCGPSHRDKLIAVPEIWSTAVVTGNGGGGGGGDVLEGVFLSSMLLCSDLRTLVY